ncbi:hypothetical protein BJ138DRAFT_1076977 [Hygrophoropsis aurantiaca]|uniref:Uncharacterized protein n=1 Tax=Hygrophoropsis aurantiaca TaxID=72124 RepID=A0ACB8ARR0_9AGAM|nr:hypothetical protein BJ138DRAFT_1076977 [Hygrophoropsis aurantiaca]
MAPSSSPRLFNRTNTPSNAASHNNIGSIIGFVIAILLLCVAIAWVALHMYRKRVQVRQNAGLSSGSDTDIVNTKQEKATQFNGQASTNPPIFSRTRITPSIIFPDKVITRVPRSPVPDSPLGASSHTSVASARYFSPIKSPSSPRHHSRSSSGFSIYTRTSTAFPSDLADSSPPQMQSRPVHHLFVPVFPDELCLRRIGECLTIKQSFDDGWCIAIRTPERESLALSPDEAQGNVELGLVPAWVFSEVTDLQQRPIRSSSVDALQAKNAAKRDTVLSWSNFA